MTDKELRKLRRDDLLQILLNQQRQIDELNEALERARGELSQRRIALEESGSIAEAALKLNGVFEAAQASADQFMAETREREEALRAKAESEAQRAQSVSDDLVRSARSEADRILREARGEGERIKAEAQKLLDEARQRTGVEPPPLSDAAGQEDDSRQRHGLLWRNRKA